MAVEPKPEVQEPIQPDAVIEEMFDPQLHVRGETKLLSKYRNETDAIRLGELIHHKDAILSMASRMEAPVGVVFGDDFGYGIDSSPSCMVIAKFMTGDKDLGRLGIIGSTRISYEQLIPTIEYFANRLGKLMTKAMRDMED